MNGDVTRQTFHSGRHYRSVRQQQGRVQLDADWNEQADIQAYLDRSVTADLVGISGAPRAYPGMAIVTGANEKPNNAADDELWIGEGHYYVDGILCENDQKVLLTAQPDLPGVALADKDDKDDKTDYIAYLDLGNGTAVSLRNCPIVMVPPVFASSWVALEPTTRMVPLLMENLRCGRLVVDSGRRAWASRMVS